MTCEKKDVFAAILAGDGLSAEAARQFFSRLPATPRTWLPYAGIASSLGGAVPFTCGIVNAKSGLCQENCAFCAQSARHAASPPVYSLVSPDILIRRAEAMAKAGIDYMGIVTSGTGPDERDFETICRTAEFISRNIGIRLCASLGILDEPQAKELSASGFTSCHHNLETSRSHYPRICTTHEYDLRAQTVLNAKKAGLRVCSGGIFGIGETWEQRVEMAEELARLEVDSIPVNFLVPVAGTPLAGAAPLPPGEALSIVSLFRLMHPKRDIVVCGGRANLGKYVPMLFAAGANGLMVGDYLTVSGRPFAEDMEMLTTLGLKS